MSGWAWGNLLPSTGLPALIASLNARMKALEAALKARVLGWYDVTDYGADPRGVGDSAPAFARAARAAAAAGAFTVYVPPGRYAFATTAALPSGTKIRGAGWHYDADGSDYGTELLRTADVVMFTATGTSVLSGGPMHRSVEFHEIRLRGNNAAGYTSDMVQLTAVAVAYFHHCQFSGAQGRTFLLHEVFDSRFVDCRFEGGGDTTGALPTIELRSGSGYEYTNQIHWVGCVFETFNGTAIGSSGSNTNELFFTNVKLESIVTDVPVLDLTNCITTHFGAVQIFTRGTTGPIPAVVRLTDCNGVTGTLLLEHSSTTGVALDSFVTLDNTSRVELVVQVNSGEQLLTGSHCVSVDPNTESTVSIRGGIRGTNPASKILSSQSLPFKQEGGIELSRFGETSLQFKRKDIADDAWALGRLTADGSSTRFRLLHNIAGTEEVIWQVVANNDVQFLQPVFLVDVGLHPAQVSTMPFGREGTLIADTNNTAAASLTPWRIYQAGGWRRLGWAAAAPVAGTWAVGDLLYNTTPAVAGVAGSRYVIHGWTCTAAGAPGTWVELRTLTGT